MEEKNVVITIDRQVSWREKEGAPELAYGPGRTVVPLALAEHLKERGFITGWSAASKEGKSYIVAERLIPSDELPGDFPSRELLYMAGHYTYGNVAELTPEVLGGLPGIGEAKAAQISEAIEQIKGKLPQVAAGGKLPAASQKPEAGQQPTASSQLASGIVSPPSSPPPAAPQGLQRAQLEQAGPRGLPGDEPIEETP